MEPDCRKLLVKLVELVVIEHTFLSFGSMLKNEHFIDAGLKKMKETTDFIDAHMDEIDRARIAIEADEFLNKEA